MACMKAVLLGRCPSAQLVDISHEIPPQDTLAGAFSLSAAFPWFPPATVFLCVVDPGVGTARPLIAAKADGRYLVGPDNGLLSLALQQAKTRQVVRLTSRRFWLPKLSGTFHGRDILAPVAAHLAAGVPLGRLGTTTRRIQAVPIPTPRQSGRRISGCVVHVDRFGNLITNLSSSLLTRRGRMHICFGRRPARVVSSYAQGRSGELIALAGSTGYLELAVRDGSAAQRLSAQRGDEVTSTISLIRPA